MTDKKTFLKILLTVAIVLIGIFLRFFHFSDWLHFELDQSYDTLVVDQAIEKGPSFLPLLGPSIGTGQELRLPPAYYYLEYASARIFGNTPVGHALLVPILSLLSVFFAFLLFRRFFNQCVAASLTVLWVFSLYIVIYARFSWNPNVLPFFLAGSLYALFRSIASDERRRGVWFLAFAALLAFTTQLHVNTFFVLFPVTFLFLLIVRPNFSRKVWFAAAAIVTVLYSPLLLNDMRGGGNIAVFQERFLHGVKRWNAFPKAMQTAQYTASEYLLILSGSDHVNGSKLTGLGFGSQSRFSWRLGALICLGFFVVLLFFKLRREQSPDRKNILRFMTLWFVVSTAYFYALRLDGFNIYPRFFLAVIPLPFFLLGLLLEELLLWKKIGKILFAVIVAGLLWSNVRGLLTYFSQLNRVTVEPMKVQTEDVFPNTARITLAQQYAIADYMEEKFRLNGFPVYLNAGHEFTPVFWYHLERRDISFHDELQDQRIYREGNYFFIPYAGSDIQNKLEPFTVNEYREFGALEVYFVSPKSEMVTAIRQDASTIEPSLQELQVSQFYTWNKLFFKESAEEEREIEEQIQDDEQDDFENRLPPAPDEQTVPDPDNQPLDSNL